MLELLRELESRQGYVPTAELASELGISERQLRRDLEALELAGYDGVELGLLEGRSAVRMISRSNGRVPLSRGSRIALVAAREVFSAFDGTDLRNDLRDAVNAVAETLRPAERSRIEGIERRIAYVPDAGVKRSTRDGSEDDASGERLDELMSGLVDYQPVQVSYRGLSGRKRSGRFEPHGVALYRHGLYFVGRWADESELRIFAAERFLEASRLRRERFDVAPDFDVRAFFDDSFGVWVGFEPSEVVLEFGPGCHRTFEVRRYHRTQTVERTKRGTTIVRFHVGLTPDLVSWILSWGEQVIVVSPRSLRDEVEEAHRAAVRRKPWQGRGG